MAPSLICGYLHTKFHFFFVLYGWLWGSGFPLTDFGSMRAHEIKKRCFEFHIRCLCIRAYSWRFVQYPVGHVAWHMLLEDNRTSCKHDFSSTSRFLVTLSLVDEARTCETKQARTAPLNRRGTRVRKRRPSTAPTARKPHTGSTTHAVPPD